MKVVLLRFFGAHEEIRPGWGMVLHSYSRMGCWCMPVPLNVLVRLFVIAHSWMRYPFRETRLARTWTETLEARAVIQTQEQMNETIENMRSQRDEALVAVRTVARLRKSMIELGLDEGLIQNLLDEAAKPD